MLETNVFGADLRGVGHDDLSGTNSRVAYSVVGGALVYTISVTVNLLNGDTVSNLLRFAREHDAVLLGPGHFRWWVAHSLALQSGRLALRDFNVFHFWLDRRFKVDVKGVGYVDTKAVELVHAVVVAGICLPDVFNGKYVVRQRVSRILCKEVATGENEQLLAVVKVFSVDDEHFRF